MTTEEAELYEQAIREVMKDYGITTHNEKQFCLQLVRLGMKMTEYTNGVLISQTRATGIVRIAFLKLEKIEGETTIRVIRYDHPRVWN